MIAISGAAFLALVMTYCAQFGHDAVSFDDPLGCTSLILAPQDGQSRAVGVAMRRLTLSTTSGFVRAWLKLIRGSMLCRPRLSPMSPPSSRLVGGGAERSSAPPLRMTLAIHA